MENSCNSRSNFLDQKYTSTSETKFSSRTGHATKLRNILKCDKPVKSNLSYADFHYEITRNPDFSLPKYVGSQQSQVLDKRFLKEDELVKYMSKLPSYIEKGKNYQDKELNVGVIDLNRLEKWRSSKTQMRGQQSGCSPSTSTSPLSSTDGSSTHSSRRFSFSPARQRVHRLSLQSKLEESLKDAHVQDAKSSFGRGQSYSPVSQRMLPSVPTYHPEKVFGGIPQKFRDLPDNMSRQQKVFRGVQCERKEPDWKSFSEMGKRSTTFDKYEVGAPWKGKSKTRCVESAKETLRSQETKLSGADRDFFIREKSDDVFMPRDLLKNKSSSFTDISILTVDGRLSVDPCQKTILERNNLEVDRPKKSTAGSKREIVIPASEELVARRSSASVPKARNPSPIRRLGSAMGKMIKNAGSRDNSPARRSSSKERGTKFMPEGVVSSVSIDNPYCDKMSTKSNRGRSSPLRRLLDPFLKPRTSNCSDPSTKHSSSTFNTINSCNEPTYDSMTSLRARSQVQAQALLQVSFKNGLPLFTFAIDNESNILAATVRKSQIPGKGDNIWTYTFFTIREVKRKSGLWSSQGGKSNDQGYVPNVIAQMKVSDSSSSFTKANNTDHHVTRDFNLFAVDGDQYANDFHPTNELAAIVIKLPRSTLENDINSGECSYNWLDMTQDSSDHSLKTPSFSSTVILPGGVHTIPSKGEISTLAERWRSGGLCDCGGWDLGCQLRVYTNKKEHERPMGFSATFMNKEKIQLFSQGNQDSQSILTLMPFKERIYSVEFSSSLSLLQAFAICMSFIDSKRPSELSEPSVTIEKITESCVFEVAVLAKTSNPPHSPVGRV